MRTEGVTELSPAGRSGRMHLLQAGLATGLAFAFARVTEPSRASKRTKRIKTKRCRPQVEQCIASLTAICDGDPGCLENLVCCDLFADCNAAAAVPCIFENAS